jgi:WD40 repeat protein
MIPTRPVTRYDPLDDYEIMYLAAHLRGAGMVDDLIHLLMDPEWILEKTGRVGLQNLINDYSFAEEVECCEQVASALRMLSTAVGDDPAQVASQLVARLSLSSSPRVKEAVQELKKWNSGPWLVPLAVGLTPVGTPLKQTLVGHKNQVRRLALMSSDRLISASIEGELILWDLNTGGELKRWVTGCRAVLDMRLLDDDHAVLGTSESPISVVRLSDGRTLHRWDRPQSNVSPILDSFSVNVAIPRRDGRIAVINGIDGTTRFEVPGEAGSTPRAAFVDADTLVTTAEKASAPYSLCVWSLSRREVIRLLHGHVDAITGLRAIAGSKVASASRDKTVKVWDLISGKILATYSGHGEVVNRVQAVGDRLLASWGATGPVHLWDRTTGRFELRIDLSEVEWLKLLLLPDGRLLSSDGKGALTTWSLGSGRKLQVLAAHGGHIWDMKPAGGFRVLTASSDRTVKAWNLAVKPSTLPVSAPKGALYHVTEIRRGRAATCSSNGSVELWDTQVGRSIGRLEGHSAPVRTAALSHDAQTLVTGSDDRTLIVWNLEKKTRTRTLQGHTAWVTAALFLTDRYLASASQDGTIRVWDVARGRVRVLSGDQGYIPCVALASPDRLVSGGEDGSLLVWDWSTRALLHKLSGHSGVITGIRPVGRKHCVSASLDRTLRVWDVRTGTCVLDFPGHRAPVQALAVDQGGLVLSGDRSGVLCCWNASSGDVYRRVSLELGGIVGLATSRGGIAAVATDGNRLVLWDVRAGRTVATYTSEHPLTHCSISTTGRRAVAADSSGNVHILKHVPAPEREVGEAGAQ